MEEKLLSELNPEITDADWERTPTSVKRLVLSQESRLKQQEQELALLLQQLGEVQKKIAILTEKKNKTHPTHPRRRQPTRLMPQSHIRKEKVGVKEEDTRTSGTESLAV